LSDKNTEVKRIAKWLYHQNENYKDNTDIFNNNEDINIIWRDFINKYKFKMFMSNEEWWYNRLNSLRDFIRKHNKLPTSREKNQNDKDLGIWLAVQKRNYNLKKEIMKEDKIREEWEQLVKENQILFMTNEEIWELNYNQLKEYIKINHKLPSSENKDTKTLYRWIHEIWMDNLNILKIYVEINNKLPSNTDSDVKIQQLAHWISSQKQNYKMKKNIMKDNVILYKEWEEFAMKYSNLFKSNNEIWNDNLQNVKNYIEKHNRLPQGCGKDAYIKMLGCWLQHQKRNYSNQKQTMKYPQIRKQWEDFTSKYPHLF